MKEILKDLHQVKAILDCYKKSGVTKVRLEYIKAPMSQREEIDLKQTVREAIEQLPPRKKREFILKKESTGQPAIKRAARFIE